MLVATRFYNTSNCWQFDCAISAIVVNVACHAYSGITLRRSPRGVACSSNGISSEYGGGDCASYVSLGERKQIGRRWAANLGSRNSMYEKHAPMTS